MSLAGVRDKSWGSEVGAGQFEMVRILAGSGPAGIASRVHQGTRDDHHRVAGLVDMLQVPPTSELLTCLIVQQRRSCAMHG
jgi:hypothetical protein